MTQHTIARKRVAMAEPQVDRQHEPGLGPPGLVGDQERDAVRRVTRPGPGGRLQHCNCLDLDQVVRV